MDPKSRPAAPRRYETFDPQTESVAEDSSVTFLVYLPEFRKEQLKVQLSSTRVLRISGERPLEDDKWKRFMKEVGVPEECDTKGIVAKFDGGILYVKQPKLVIPAAGEPHQGSQIQPAPAPEPTTASNKMEEGPIKEGNEADQTATEGRKEDHGKSCDDHALATGYAHNAHLINKNEQETGQDEGKGRYRVAEEQGKVVRGGRFQPFQEVMEKNNSRNLMLIAVLVVALLLRMIYT